MRILERVHRAALVLLAPVAITAAFLHVGLGILFALLCFAWIGRRGRDLAIMVWSRILLLIVGVRLELPTGPAPSRDAPGGSLLLVNHISWLDVFAIAAVVPARFVAKAEIGRWPLFGWLAILVGTLFVERGRRHAVMRTNHELARRLRAGQLIAIFPEGTTTDGTRLLPFHANLVQPAIELGVPLRPVGVRFMQKGRPSLAAIYIDDMNLLQSMWRVTTAPHLTAELHWLAPLDPAPASRHAAGRAARESIARALQLPLVDRAVADEVSAVTGSEDTEPDTRSAAAS
jgi:1-acyl-sn-glycerol-3-phosphate acyltransferase